MVREIALQTPMAWKAAGQNVAKNEAGDESTIFAHSFSIVTRELS